MVQLTSWHSGQDWKTCNGLASCGSKLAAPAFYSLLYGRADLCATCVNASSIVGRA